MYEASSSTQSIIEALEIIEEENERIADEEGGKPLRITGKIFFIEENNSTWFEVANEYNTTSLLSLDFPGATAVGEVCVAADDENHARTFGNDVY